MTCVNDRVYLVVVFGSDNLAYFFSSIFSTEKKSSRHPLQILLKSKLH